MVALDNSSSASSQSSSSSSSDDDEPHRDGITMLESQENLVIAPTSPNSRVRVLEQPATIPDMSAKSKSALFWKQQLVGPMRTTSRYDNSSLDFPA